MKGYLTHEAFWSDFRMYVNMLKWAVIWGILIQVSILIYGLYSSCGQVWNARISATDTELPITVAFKYYTGLVEDDIADLEKELQPYSNGHQRLYLDDYRHFVDYLTDGVYLQSAEKLNKIAGYSFSGYLFSCAYLIFFFYTGRLTKDKTFLRGAQISPLDVLKKKLVKAAAKNPLSCLCIGEVPIPYEMESQHILVLGTTGTGKGVLLNQLAMQLYQRKVEKQTGEKCVFYDLKGEFVSKQYNPNYDMIFNPFDERSLGWNIFNELEIQPDYDVISKSLFLAPDTKDEYWYNCAKDVFRTGLVYLNMQGTTTNKDLWEFFSQPLSGYQEAFYSLPIGEQGAMKHIDKQDSPASASIISIVQERIGFFKYLQGKDGDFSFRKFIREQKKNEDGVAIHNPDLFLLNIDQYEQICKPLMTLAIDTMIRETLSLPDKLDRRIFFILDELGSLYKMESILKLETVGRSKGACLVCANQDLGRIEERYGKPNLKTFFNNFNTTVTFRVKEPETAEFLSKAVGEQQIILNVQSRNMSPSDMGDRKNIAEQEKMERILIPAEFQNLPKLHAILNVADYGITNIKIPPIFYKEKYPNFVLRQGMEIDRDEKGAVPIPAEAPIEQILEQEQEIDDSQFDTLFDK
jgi:Type IV secretory pathway, VirD4 components